MTINSTCDLFPGKEPDLYSNLQDYMVNWCLNQMEDIRLLEMQSIMKTGLQRTAFGFICLWAFCSYLSLFIAAYKWCFAEKKGFKLQIMTMLLLSFAMVSLSSA